MGRGAWSAIVCACGLAACGGPTFLCAQDNECSGEGGACIEGYCAFPDTGCDSGLRYGDHAGDLSGSCVPVSEGGTETGGPLDDDGASETGAPPSSTSADSDSDGGTPTDSSDGVDDATETGDPIGPVEFVDDELVGEFDGGHFEAVEFVDGRLQLTGEAPEGRFVSRVFDAGAAVHWDTLLWIPDAPYAKPLPDAGAVESGYPDGVDMSDAVLLMHFDEAGTLAEGTEIVDASGHDNHGSIASDGPSSQGVPGVFGNAIDDHPDAYVSIPPGTEDFNFGTDDFSWAMWFRFEHGCETNNVFMGIDDGIGGGDGSAHLWMGCTSGDWTECPEATGVKPAGAFIATHASPDSDGIVFCGAFTIDDGQWHHMAVVKSGHVNGLVSQFVDGMLVTSEPATFDQALDMTIGEGDFALGGFSGGTFPTSGTYDEAAIWTRALDEEQIRGLYRRGALYLAVEVRTCEQPQCADAPPFVGGPDLLPDGVFLDAANATSPGTEQSIAGLPERPYAQYRLTLGSLQPSLTPSLGMVALYGNYAGG